MSSADYSQATPPPFTDPMAVDARRPGIHLASTPRAICPHIPRLLLAGLVIASSACALARYEADQVRSLGMLLPQKAPPARVFGPDSAFTVRTPPLLTPGAKVSVHRPKPGVWYVAFGDELCRGFILTVSSDTNTTPVDQVIRERFIPNITTRGALNVTQRIDTLDPTGPATFVGYRVPRGAPCKEEEVNGGVLGMFGKRKSHEPDAEVGRYFFRRGTQVFDALYIKGEDALSGSGDSAFGIRVRPIEAVLQDFVRGIVFAQNVVS